VLKSNKAAFAQNVSKSMRGGSVGGVSFDNVLKKN
jgi:hypothetical protein